MLVAQRLALHQLYKLSQWIPPRRQEGAHWKLVSPGSLMSSVLLPCLVPSLSPLRSRRIPGQGAGVTRLCGSIRGALPWRDNQTQFPSLPTFELELYHSTNTHIDLYIIVHHHNHHNSPSSETLITSNFSAHPQTYLPPPA